MALPTLQIQVLCGPWAGRRIALREAPVVCGREPSSTVLLDGPHVSRKHCELIELEGQWAVVNHSPNGLRVDGRKVAGKPMVLEEGATISVGDSELFRINLGPTPTVELPQVPEEEADAAKPGAAAKPKKRKTKMWIGMGIYMVLLLGLFVYISTIPGKSSQQAVQPAELSTEQIDRDVRRARNLPSGGLDERAAQEFLEKARLLSQRTAVTVDGVYQAYDAYRLSLAASGKRVFDSGSDQAKYLDLQETLVQKVTELYKDAYVTLRNPDYISGSAKFKRLREIYPDSESIVYRNADQQLQYAKQKMGKKKF